jgi:hypothetical protein
MIMAKISLGELKALWENKKQGGDYPIAGCLSININAAVGENLPTSDIVTLPSRSIIGGVSFVSDKYNPADCYIYIYPNNSTTNDVVGLEAGDYIHWNVNNLNTLSIKAVAREAGTVILYYWSASNDPAV